MAARVVKTQLAIEIAAWAREQSRTAGFARYDNLGLFQSIGCRTVWDKPIWRWSITPARSLERSAPGSER